MSSRNGSSQQPLVPLSTNELEAMNCTEEFRDIMKISIWTAAHSSLSERDYYQSLNDKIVRQVTAKPILAMGVSTSNSSSLLLALVSGNIDHTAIKPAIKLLIEKNPSALLWIKDSDDADTKSDAAIYIIAAHRIYSVFMPWIAKYFAWILLHEPFCIRAPRNHNMSSPKQYNNSCAALKGKTGDCLDFDFCKQMTEKKRAKNSPCSKDILYGLYSQMHMSCYALVHAPTDTMAGIIEFLLEVYPQSVQIYGIDNILPIHILTRACNHPIVRKSSILLLRNYPESYDMRPRNEIYYHVPCSIPFIRKLKTYLDEEQTLEREYELFEMASNNLLQASSTSSMNHPLTSGSVVFQAWANSHNRANLEKKSALSGQMHELCYSFQEL